MVFLVADADNGGKLSLEESVEFIAYEALAEEYPGLLFERAFEAFDKDKSEALDTGEPSRFLRVTEVENADQEASALVAQAGENGLTFIRGI
jgi:Ca2+-binding EF-hand superfamily protein